MSGAIAVLMAAVKGLQATISPSSLLGVKAGIGTVTTSGSTTVTVSGGQIPYSYVWTFVSGNASILPVSPTSASTKFSIHASSLGSYTAVYKCVVDDSASGTVDSPTVSISLRAS